FGLSNNTSGSQLPSIEAKYGSEVELVHPRCRAYSNFVSRRAVFGACASVKFNSTLKVKASVNGAAIFVGPPSYTNQQFMSVLNADNNSTIELCGPILLGQGGVAALAENQSTIK